MALPMPGRCNACVSLATQTASGCAKWDISRMGAAAFVCCFSCDAWKQVRRCRRTRSPRSRACCDGRPGRSGYATDARRYRACSADLATCVWWLRARARKAACVIFSNARRKRKPRRITRPEREMHADLNGPVSSRFLFSAFFILYFGPLGIKYIYCVYSE